MFPPMILPPGPYRRGRATGNVSMGSCHQVQSIGHGLSGGDCLMGQGDGSYQFVFAMTHEPSRA
ncbi:hypothetical protein, partial [Novacetimonas hansenii]|uniref:hypothetical protein n=1 Tax=Novacetimonas hansenii TaxID=436 RepID=UPI001A7EB32B